MTKMRHSSRKLTPKRLSATGVDCAGENLTRNRVWIWNNTTLTTNEMISVGGFLMTPDVDYTISHKTTGTQVTFLGIIQNTQRLEALYFI